MACSGCLGNINMVLSPSFPPSWLPSQWETAALGLHQSAGHQLALRPTALSCSLTVGEIRPPLEPSSPACTWIPKHFLIKG